MSDIKLLARFQIDCGRMGELDGLFVVTQAALDSAYGKQFYMSDVLGKHSEISGELDASHIKIIDADAKFIASFEALIGQIGINPIDYIDEGDEP